MSADNINTKSYWDNRFKTGDWEAKAGRNQTRNFAISQIKHLRISKDFSGIILDFGCGLGDAFPIYKKAFPHAKLIGIDISEEAIHKCNQKYGQIATFYSGTSKDVPVVDKIIASNVLEHLTDDRYIAKDLLKKCQQLYIIVPYNEGKHDDPVHEHVNTYDEFYFNEITNKVDYKIFISKGWGDRGINLYYHTYLKNIAKFILMRKVVKRAKQIMFVLHKANIPL